MGSPMASFIRRLIALDDVELNDWEHVRLTKVSLVARVVRAAGLVFAYLALTVFMFAQPLSHFAASLNDPPALSFLRDQYDFLVSRGVPPPSAAVPLRLWECLIWVLSAIILGRVLSSPFLFGVVDWRKRLRQTGRPAKALLGLLLMPGAIWASMDIRISSAVFASLLNRAPRAFICLEAFVFLGALVLFVEGLIALADFAVSSVRSRSARSLG
jgi:hypothetical protein